LEAVISKIGSEEDVYVEYPVSIPMLSDLNVEGQPSLGIILCEPPLILAGIQGFGS
jgi:hypothetical protein